MSLLSTFYPSEIKDSTYVIPFEKDLDGTTLTMPANCVLKFENGGMLKNGTLKGDNTFIQFHKYNRFKRKRKAFSPISYIK